MLVNLHVKNLALVKEADIDFTEGLNILTGETGAGKSIIIGSINLALGEKNGKDMRRENEEPALVELVFQVEREKQREQLRLLGIDAEDGQVILSRKLVHGKSVNKINGETVTIGKLREVSGMLIDIHGQHEHQSLLNKKKHLEILDEFGKEALAEPKKRLKEAFQKYQQLSHQLKEAVMDESQRRKEMSFLEFELEEIRNAALKAGEDQELEQQYGKMVHGKKIIEAVSMVHRETGYEEGAAAGEALGRAMRELSRVTAYDPALEGLYDQLGSIESLLNDFNRELSEYMQEMDFSEEDFAETESRLNQVNMLKAKYGKTIEEVLAYAEEKEQRLLQLADYEAYLADVTHRLSEAEAQVEACCAEISGIRRQYAELLKDKIVEQLIDLNFLDVQFAVELTRLDHYTANGYEEAEFLISTNPGEPMRPMGRVASGGELSRIMLAIKTLLADRDEIDTVIFDEIDVGISGRTAQKVSEKMAVIAQNRQVICITHLAQLAAMADSHFVIEKEVSEGETITSMRRLQKEEMVQELARILGGVEITDAVLENAREMKRLAEAFSNTLQSPVKK